MGHTGWDIIYDFLDEILASIMPGAYFVSYFVLWSAFFFKKSLFSGVTEGAIPLFGLFAIVMCYCLGTVFRRSDMKKIDKKSAYSIYKAQTRTSGSFAFAENLHTAMEPLRERYAGLEGDLSLEALYQRMYPKTPDSLPERARAALTRRWTSAYGQLRRYYRRLKWKVNHKNREDLRPLLEELKPLLFPEIDYPYVNLGGYLAARELSISRRAQWNQSTRSKMKTNTYKVEIAAKMPNMMSVINKNEAHIRFMNSMWCASAVLLWCALFIGLASAALWALLPCAVQGSALLQLFSRNNLFIVAVISLLYVVVSLFVKHGVKKIIHYQRVRELVFLLTTYDEISGMDAPV